MKATVFAFASFKCNEKDYNTSQTWQFRAYETFDSLCSQEII